MANVNIQLGYKDSAWFAANATLVLLAGQVVYLQQTGTYKIGDGTTQLQNLAFKGIAQQTDIVVATVVNNTGVNLLASNYQAVKVSTAQGQRLAVDFAQANNDNNSADTIGLVKENINVNQEGKVVILGQIVEVNTTGSLQGETWTDGDVIYLSPTTAGSLTNVKPTGLTGHIVVIGYVEYAHAVHGKIYTKIANGWELEELHNVADISYTTPIDADSLLIKDSTASLWKRLTWANLKKLFFRESETNVTSVAEIGCSNSRVTIGSYNAGGSNNYPSLWANKTTAEINATNYIFQGDGITRTFFNAPGYLAFNTFNVERLRIYPPNHSTQTKSFYFTPSSSTGQLASTEINGFNYENYSRQWSNGAISLQREHYYKSTTYSFTLASTITDAYEVYIESPTAGTNATITNNYSLGTNGKAKFGGNIELTQTVTTETVTSDTTVTIKINGVNYKLLAKS